MEKNVNVVITNHCDDHEKDYFVMSETAFTAISWFLITYGLSEDYDIKMIDDFKPEILPF